LDDKKADFVLTSKLQYDEPMMPQPSPATQRPPSPLERPDPDLVGNPPKFDGDRANAILFLAEFETFMVLNCNTPIARNPTRRAAYFLNITRGPAITVKNWVDRNINWFHEVIRNPDLVPEETNAWEVLKTNFRKSFEDHLGSEIAGIKLQELHMTEDRLDDYIAEFEGLARRAGYDLNDPLAIRYFVRGLPRKLIKDCIDNGRPESFEEWASAAHRQHRTGWLIQAYSRLRDGQQPPDRGATWRNGQPARQDIPPAGPRTTPRNSNPSTTVDDKNRKAITEDDKERYRREGRCYHCGTKGHMARHCPDRAHTHKRSTTERT
jgi:hypothetical protein